MTALAKDRKTDELDTSTFPRLLSFPIEANTIIYAGGMVATNAAGNAVPASSIGALKLWGRAEKTMDNRTASGVGTAGALFIETKPGVYFLNNGTGADALGLADIGNNVFASDDNTVNKTDAGGTRPYAGIMYPACQGTTTHLATNGQVAVLIGMPNAYVANPELTSSSGAFRARNIGSPAANVASLAAYTVASNDGVTNVAGDVIILAAQTTAAQNGPYVVGTVTAGAAPLTRPDWWAAAATLASGLVIEVGGEGTVYKNTSWKAMVAAATFVVDTTDPKLYPVRVGGQTALSSGTFTISVPVFSTKTTVTLNRVAIGGTVTSTIMYVPTTSGGATGITAGAAGTGAIVVTAQPASGAATVDTSTINWTVNNQA